MLRRIQNGGLLKFTSDAQHLQLDSRLEVHDNNQVELKLDYTIDAAAHRTQYQTEAYFFLPKSLGISKRSYDRDHFYRDTQAYIRFQTPRLPLRALTDPENQSSPLFRIRAYLNNPQGCANELEHGELSQEIRMFGCVVRSILRRAVAGTEEQLASLLIAANPTDQILSIQKLLLTLADDVDAVCQTYRSLATTIQTVNHPHWLPEYLAYADEYLSLTIEAYLTTILAAFDAHELVDELAVAWSRLGETIGREQQHRIDAGYRATLDNEHGRKRFVAHSSSLKKFITSVLFLDVVPRNEGSGMMQFAAALAAAAAMTFSTTAAIASGWLWGINSLPFVLAVVIAYVFKDRIKDWVRSFCSAKIAGWIPDRSLVVVDPENEMKVGQCRESFSFLNEERLPVLVKQWRNTGTDDASRFSCLPEVVLHYVKNVTIHGKRIGDAHGRRRGINDIIRWNLSSFMARMDDPERLVDYFDRNTQQLMTAVCPKRYDLHVVLLLKAEERLVSVERFCVTLDRDGIQSLERTDIQPMVEMPTDTTGETNSASSLRSRGVECSQRNSTE